MAIRERYGFKTIPKSAKGEEIYRNEKLNVSLGSGAGSKLNKDRLGVQLTLRDIQAEEGRAHVSSRFNKLRERVYVRKHG